MMKHDIPAPGNWENVYVSTASLKCLATLLANVVHNDEVEPLRGA